MVGKHFFIGISERTNPLGAAQLGEILERYGNTWISVPVGAGLHLKSSVNWVGGDTLLISAAFAGQPEFEDYHKLWLIQKKNTPATPYGSTTPC